MTAPSSSTAQVERIIPRRNVTAWALWDWATQPFNTVIITFVFASLYLTSDAFLDPAIAALGEGNELYDAAIAELSQHYGWGLTAAGILVALFAPVLGQRADAGGTRKRWIGWMTLVLVACQLGLFFVEAAPDFFWLGVGCIALGSIVGEIAGVNYNAMIVQVSTKKTMGRVSGLGWGLGYVGGIVAMVIVVVLTQFDWFGMDTSNGMAYRMIALGCAVWTVAFAWPLLVYVPEGDSSERPKVGLLAGYVQLAKDLGGLWRDARSTLWFLLASAVYRDGLAGVFTFGAILAARAFGFSTTELMFFGIAANLIAGLATIAAGRLDDRFGPRAVIVASLALIIASGIGVMVFQDGGTTVFWIFGLVLSGCVGPAQAASRSLLARVAPHGKEAEIFGLYATTGRAVSFLAPLAWSVSLGIFGAIIWGTVGVISVVALGLAMLLLVKTPADKG
ncbi:MFS transporter [Demequina pelophila]|uniref:MFS transporter n=1 Tax=Demequina pelophila TaxID=1638984 RepID=UPI000ACC2361|nr:MFS transporter [Demequina pelophila]